MPGSNMVPKEGVEPSCPCGHVVLNHARLPFRHFGMPDCETNYNSYAFGVSINPAADFHFSHGLMFYF